MTPSRSANCWIVFCCLLGGCAFVFPTDTLQPTPSGQPFASFAGFPDAGGDINPANCFGICRSDEVCNVKTNACERKHCGGGCLAGWECDEATNACGIPCGKPCLGVTACNHATLQCESVCGVGCPDAMCNTLSKKCAASCLPFCGDDALCVPVPQGLGACKPAKLPHTWSAETNVAVTFTIAQKADGCDLNGDGKPDNALSGVTALVGSSSSAQTIAFVPDSFATDGSAFALSAYDVAHDTTITCGSTDTWCTYGVDKDSFDIAACDVNACPVVAFTTAATIQNGQLLAKLPALMVHTALALPLHNVAVSGEVKGVTHWEATKNGKLCGAVLMTDFAAALAQSAVAAGLDMAPDQIKKLAATLVHPDLDLDGDGVMESISAAYVFETAPRAITGYLPNQ